MTGNQILGAALILIILVQPLLALRRRIALWRHEGNQSEEDDEVRQEDIGDRITSLIANFQEDRGRDPMSVVPNPNWNDHYRIEVFTDDRSSTLVKIEICVKKMVMWATWGSLPVPNDTAFRAPASTYYITDKEINRLIVDACKRIDFVPQCPKAETPA